MYRTKKAGELRHAIRRLDERFNLGIVALAQLSDKIRNGRARVVKCQSRRVKIYELTIEKQLMHVVYDCQRKQVVTVLLPTSKPEKPKIKKEKPAPPPGTYRLGPNSGTWHTLEEIKYMALVVEHRAAADAVLVAMLNEADTLEIQRLSKEVQVAWNKIIGDPQYPANRSVDRAIEKYGLPSVIQTIRAILKNVKD